MKKSLRIEFGGAGKVSIDWNGEVTGIASLAQKAGVAVMTHVGSDKLLPERGTDVAAKLSSYGVFDLLSMQHLLNFGSLKARADIQAHESSDLDAGDRVANVKMTLLSVADNAANVGVRVTNQSGQSTREIIEIK
jgi:hypothetical protein